MLSAFSAQYPSHTLMDAALLQTLLQAFVHREKVQTVDAALEQDIQLMLQVFFGKNLLNLCAYWLPDSFGWPLHRTRFPRYDTSPRVQ